MKPLNETCFSPSVEININIHNSNLNENYSDKKLVGLFDILGRPIKNIKDEYFYFKLYEDGLFTKEINFNQNRSRNNNTLNSEVPSYI